MKSRTATVFQDAMACCMRGGLAAMLVLCAATGPARAADISLADYPLFSTVKVPGNLALALSVEWPTATSAAYLSTTTYSTSSTFIGYFNPDMCYSYVYNSSSPVSSYFKPVTAASSHACTSGSGYWSGNFLNYASMQTLDELRWIMTGGFRITDTNTTSVNLNTILTKTWSSSSRATSASVVPNKSLSDSTTIAGATPFSGVSSFNTRIWGLGRRMWFTNTGTSGSPWTSASTATEEYNATQTTAATAYTGGTSLTAATVYEVYINVAVCVNASLKESNCTLYGSVYKPEGLMQNYAMQLRYGTFGYLLDNGTSSNSATDHRDGGVLRARMNYIGPSKPVPGSSDVTNATAPEWSSSTGIMYTDPASTDSNATNSNFSISSVTSSGNMNYLNKFGYTARNYKSKDPVSELYYAVTRYFRGLSNVSSYTSGTTATLADGFPVITDWTSSSSYDPLIYTCQKNFILGIGDVNTHRDADLYGSTLRTYLENTMPSAVSSDTAINVATATNMVGQLEGKSGLGSLYAFDGTVSLGTGSSDVCSTISNSASYKMCNTYYMAGLAYHIHTNDIRSTTSSSDTDTNMNNDTSTGKQTVSTYWIDIMEDQTYQHKNQYWLAAKYGGFTVPSSFAPYSSSNSTSTLAETTWYNNTDTNCAYTTTKKTTFTTDSTTCGSSTTAGSSQYADKRPDNYFYGYEPATIKSNLTSAFSKISSELSSSTSTAFAMVKPNVTSGDTSYSATYDPTSWTSSLQAFEVTYDTSGNATLSSAIWDARDLLEDLSSPASSRRIVTYCDAASTPAGIAFTATELDSCTSSTASSSSTRRLYYSSFSSISNTTSTSSTPQTDYVRYLRGSRTNEISSSGSSSTRIYRKRSYLLGDIVNSKVASVGAPSAAYYDVYNPGYSSFKRAYKNRRTVVYAGGNDGMLHAFDGTLPSYNTANNVNTYFLSTCSECGQELFAYVPSFAFKGSTGTATTSGLASLGDPSRTHYYFVDATPLAFDLDLNNVCESTTTSSSSTCTRVNGGSGASSTSNNWKTVLIGGLGKGGKGYYAIDVTHPGLVTESTSTSSSSCAYTKCRTIDTSSGVTQTVSGTSTTVPYYFSDEATVASKVLWEFPKSSDSTTIARMGYSYGAPIVVKTKKYGWVAVFTSGYNNSDGKGYFFFVSPATGALLETVATSSGSTSSPINLAQADAYVPNHADFTADAIYGGDLRGNLWRVDLTPTATDYSAPTLMATLTNAAGDTQPVTTRPLIEVDPSTGKRYVLVGTGRLLADSDIKSSSLQSIYSIYDGTSGAGSFRSAATYSTALTRSDLNANTSLLTGISSTATNVNGWYFDLGSSSSIAERMNVEPATYSGVAAFGVNLPYSFVCSPGGTGYVLAVNIGTGKTVLQDSSGNLVASVSLSGLVTGLTMQNVDGSIRFVAGDSKPVTIPTSINTSSGLTRLNWRVVPTN